jgi:hypothetical protein
MIITETRGASRAGSQSAIAALATFGAVGALAAGTALATSPRSAADEQHTIVYEITGSGHASAIHYDPPATDVSTANGTNYPSLPWSTTVQVMGHPLAELSWVGRDGGPFDCVITVDGHVAPVSKPSAGLCTYQIPAGSGQGSSASVNQQIWVSQCTHGSNSEHCDQAPGAAIDTSGPTLKIAFTASPKHCSDIQVTFLVDGNIVTGGLRVAPGQTVTANPGVGAGHHYVQVEANGIQGGCNQGTLESWGGELHLE